MFLLVIFGFITYARKPTSHNSPGFPFTPSETTFFSDFSHTPALARAAPGMTGSLCHLEVSCGDSGLSLALPWLTFFNGSVCEDTGSRITKSPGDSKPVKIHNMMEAAF